MVMMMGITGWTFFGSLAECYRDNAARDGSHADYWTDSKTHAWIDRQGRGWVLTFVQATSELLLFVQDQDEDRGRPAWVSRPWPSQQDADTALSGYPLARGDGDWLMERLNGRP